ncbi:hypothetical protein LZ30DRAFT_729122 [Colletotrichum cereale]|nr:hypothetical protein LZ30DRAFT_729122 [Colletotrichum cereale]
MSKIRWRCEQNRPTCDNQQQRAARPSRTPSMDWPAPCLSRDQWLEHERHAYASSRNNRFVVPRLFPAQRTPGARRLNPNRPLASRHVPKDQPATCISVTQPCEGVLRLAEGGFGQRLFNGVNSTAHMGDKITEDSVQSLTTSPQIRTRSLGRGRTNKMGLKRETQCISRPHVQGRA